MMRVMMVMMMVMIMMTVMTVMIDLVNGIVGNNKCFWNVSGRTKTYYKEMLSYYNKCFLCFPLLLAAFC